MHYLSKSSGAALKEDECNDAKKDNVQVANIYINIYVCI